MTSMKVLVTLVLPAIYLLAILVIIRDVYSYKSLSNEAELFQSLRADIEKQYNSLLTSLANITCTPTNCIESNEHDVILDLEDFPNLVGPRKHAIDPSKKKLVVICIGKSDKQRVDSLIKYFPPGNYTYLLFHYDSSSWDEFKWYNSIHIVAIRVIHKMKFWYLKRFLTPSMAKAFSHIIILDADVQFADPFDADLYLKVADAFNLSLSQPAHAAKISHTYHSNLYEVKGYQIGRYTDVVECGPAVFLTSEGYNCIYELMQIDLTSGWGIDLLWVDYMQTICGLGPNRAAVLDKFRLIHDTKTGLGTASSQGNFNARAKIEMEVFFERFPEVQQGHQRAEVGFGWANCINTTDIASRYPCD